VHQLKNLKIQMERNRSANSASGTQAAVEGEGRKLKLELSSKLDFRLEGSRTIKLRTQGRLKDSASSTPMNEAAGNKQPQVLNSELKKKRKELILKLRISSAKKSSAFQTFDCPTPGLEPRISNCTTDTGS
jgi:hypothetical protein